MRGGEPGDKASVALLGERERAHLVVLCLQEASLKGCTLQLVIQHCTLAALATDLLSMYMYIVPI